MAEGFYWLERIIRIFVHADVYTGIEYLSLATSMFRSELPFFGGGGGDTTSSS